MNQITAQPQGAECATQALAALGLGVNVEHLDLPEVVEFSRQELWCDVFIITPDGVEFDDPESFVIETIDQAASEQAFANLLAKALNVPVTITDNDDSPDPSGDVWTISERIWNEFEWLVGL